MGGGGDIEELIVNTNVFKERNLRRFNRKKKWFEGEAV